MPDRFDDSEAYLAERLAEQRDAFTRQAPTAPGQPERVSEIVGPAHLDGRRVRDRFVRSTPARPQAQAQPPAEGAGALEPHLASRLAEIQDQPPRPSAAITPERAALETYRALRRQLGGS